jgi:hypothetical protein
MLGTTNYYGYYAESMEKKFEEKKYFQTKSEDKWPANRLFNKRPANRLVLETITKVQKWT